MEFPEKIPQAKPEKTTNYLANINDWANAEKVFNIDFANKIDENRKIGFYNLEKFDLPRYKHKNLSLKEFLSNSSKFLEELESDIFYISLIPKNPDLKREGRAGLRSGEVIDFINHFVPESDMENYDVAIEQMFNNVFGGSIVVDPKGNVYFEFIEGNQTAVSKGNAEIKYIVFRDVHVSSFKYSFEDEHIRKIAFEAIMNIPHKGEGREMQFLPGYYEMVIAQRDNTTKPETKFLDYRDNDAYQIDWDKANLAV